MDVTMYLVLTCVVLVAYWFYQRYRHMTLLHRHGFKGPKNTNLFSGRADLLVSENNVKQFDQLFKKYGDVVAFYIGGFPALIVQDEELLKNVLIKDFHLFSDRQIFGKGPYASDIATSNLIAATDQRWRNMRGIVTPTFTSGKLKHMAPIMNQSVNQLMSKLDKDSEGGKREINVYTSFQGLTMDAIARSAFGITTNTSGGEHPLIVASRAVFTSKTPILHAATMFFPGLEGILYPIRTLITKMKELTMHIPRQYIYSVCASILEGRRKSDKQHADLLQNLIDASSDEGSKKMVLSDNEIIANSFIFLEAGYETTSTTLTFITHVLVNHQDVQDKMKQELAEFKTKHGTEPDSYLVMTELPYMDAVIHEALRLYQPVTYFTNRVAKEDYPYQDKIIPKGTTIFVPGPQIHRNPKFWPEPDTFDPMRFYKTKINPVHFLAFGAGPRNCIGMRFAMLEMKLALSKLLTTYRLEAGPSTEIGSLALTYRRALMSPTNGVHVRLVAI
ncbi:Cytochrome P450 3A24 [Halotydeus destructor]|nr:Cytochrome P450 3A24 [Halotydeus destructor]